MVMSNKYLIFFFTAILFSQQSLCADIRLIFDASQLIPNTENLQLECVGGTAQGSEFEPDFVECSQRIINGKKEWECEAHLGPFVTFDNLEVYCMDSESVENLKNGEEHRCGLKYTLDYTDETTLTGSFITIVFVLILLIFIARQRRPPNTQLPNSPNGGAAGGGGIGLGLTNNNNNNNTPVNPQILRGMAYGIFGIVAFATVIFSAIIFYLCTSVTTLIT